MPICLDLCFHMLVCLDLCSLHVLCYLPCACALHAMFVCLDLGYVCHAMCYCCPFVALSFFLEFWPFVFLSCVLAYRFEPNLDPMVFVIVHTPWPTSKGLDHSYLHVYACLLLCFMLILAFLVLGFTTLDALNGFVVVWLHLTPMRLCSDVTIWEASLNARLLHAYHSLFRSTQCYACHACLCHPLAFYASLHACSHVHA